MAYLLLIINVQLHYCVLGIPLCRHVFRYMNGIGHHRLNVLRSHYKRHGISPRDFHYRGRNNQAVTFEEASRIVEFMNSVSEIHALALPGRVPGNFRPI